MIPEWKSINNLFKAYEEIMTKVTNKNQLIPDGVEPEDATGLPTHIISPM